MEIEVGEYVRIKNGDIRKIVCIAEGKEKTVFGKYRLDKPYNNCYSVAKSKIINHSKNIIDLIEVGDIVNGCKVHGIKKELVEVCLDVGAYFVDYDYIHNSSIKTILTHEQYSNNSYKVVE